MYAEVSDAVIRFEGIKAEWDLQGSIRSREWSKSWCFAPLHGKCEVCDDVGSGPRESVWPAEKAVREFFDSEY